jgi:hypothetical protein
MACNKEAVDRHIVTEGLASDAQFQNTLALGSLSSYPGRRLRRQELTRRRLNRAAQSQNRLGYLRMEATDMVCIICGIWEQRDEYVWTARWWEIWAWMHFGTKTRASDVLRRNERISPLVKAELAHPTSA